MDIMKIGTQLLAAKLSNNANSDQITNVLGSLLGGDSNSNAIDLGGILGSLQSSGLGDVAKSWLGDGANDEISENQLEGLFGSEKIQEMASQLGTDQNDLLAGLKEALPQMIDQSSSDGNLLDSVGGISGLAGIASKFLK